MSRRFLIVAAGSVALFLGAASAQAAFQLEPLTSFGGGDGFMSLGEGIFPATADNNQRGVAYNAANNHLYVVNRTGGLTVPILNGDTGAQIGALDTTGIAGGTFAANQIRVADDGAIYAANLTTGANTGTGALKIYRWANESAVPTVVYSGDAGAAGARFGDTLDVRGSGTGTQILLGRGGNTAGTGHQFVILSTTDGNTFTPTVYTPDGVAAGDFRLGITFGQGNTVYGKQTGSANLRRVTFDPVAGTATTETNNTLPTSLTGLDYDAANNLLGGFVTGNTTTAGSHDARLFEVGNFTDLVQVDEQDFPTANANSNGAGSTAFGNGRMYVLVTNNGIGAFTVVIPEPGTLSLLGLGAVGLLACRRK